MHKKLFRSYRTDKISVFQFKRLTTEAEEKAAFFRKDWDEVVRLAKKKGGHASTVR